MFIGEDLGGDEVKVLQAVKDAVTGYQFTSLESVKGSLREEIDGFEEILSKLEGEFLIECKVIRGQKHYCLTEDGEACNRIH